MQHNKLFTATIVASLFACSVAMAAPPSGLGPKEHKPHQGDLRHQSRGTPAPRGAPRHRLPPNAVKVRIDGATLWVSGSTYYRRQPKQNLFIPVAVTPAQPKIRTTTTLNGPYYDQLPAGSHAVIIKGSRYFSHRGMFYRPVHHNGRIAYIRVRF